MGPPNLVIVTPCRLPYQSRPETDALARRAQERAAAELYAYQQQQAPVQAADLEQRPVYEWVRVQWHSRCSDPFLLRKAFAPTRRSLSSMLIPRPGSRRILVFGILKVLF